MGKLLLLFIWDGIFGTLITLSIHLAIRLFNI